VLTHFGDGGGESPPSLLGRKSLSAARKTQRKANAKRKKTKEEKSAPAGTPWTGVENEGPGP
jgi:hypothetical protein